MGALCWAHRAEPGDADPVQRHRIEFRQPDGWGSYTLQMDASVVVTAALVVAILAYVTNSIYQLWTIRRRTRLSLTYAVPFDAHLVSDLRRSALSVFHEGTRVSSPRLVVVNVLNEGNRTVTENDWRKPLTFRIPGSTILTAKIVGEEATLFPAVKFVIDPPDTATLDGGIFLNPKMTLKTEFMVDGGDADCMVDGLTLDQQGKIRPTSQPLVRKLLSRQQVLFAASNTLLAAQVLLFLTTEYLDQMTTLDFATGIIISAVMIFVNISNPILYKNVRR